MTGCIFTSIYAVGVWLSCWVTLIVAVINMRLELPNGTLTRYALWSVLSWFGGYMIYKDIERRV